MKKYSLPALLAAASLLAALPAAAKCKHSADRNADEDLSGISRVEIKAEAGDLDLEARPGRSLEVRGEACASSRSLLDKIELLAERSGDVLRLRLRTPDGKGWNSYARLDVTMGLPADMPVSIDDGSGDLVARGVTLDKVEDGSGDIRLTDTLGTLSIGDGSGDLVASGHRGDLRVNDGSGDVRVRDLEGTVVISSDGSGDLDLDEVTGDVEVRSDGSGDIVAERVGGDFTVGSAGSGDVRYRDITGRIDVPSRR